MKEMTTFAKEQVLPICQDLTYNLLARRAARMVDLSSIDRLDLDTPIGNKETLANYAYNNRIGNPLSVTEMAFNSERRVYKSSLQRNPIIDFNFSVSFHPLKRKILALTWFEQKRYTEAWTKLPFVHDYHYQNQTDRPEEISAREYNQRRKDWEAVYTPMLAINGFSFNPIPEYFPEQSYWNQEAFSKHIPSYADRHENLLKELLMQYMLRNKLVTTDRYFEVLNGCKGWKLTQVGIEKEQEFRDLLDCKLIRDLAYEDLTRGIVVGGEQLKLMYPEGGAKTFSPSGTW